MTSSFTRASVPGRGRPADSRPGTFKPGHEKRGGRKRGTPNAISSEYEMAILEAAYRVGFDGNGKDGIRGYFKWVCQNHQGICATELLGRILLVEEEDAERNMSAEPTGDINQTIREWIERNPKRTKSQAVHPESVWPSGWTGQDFPVSSLMEVAVEKPKVFCRLYGAVFLRPKTKRRPPQECTNDLRRQQRD